MDAGLLDMLHDAADHHPLAVGQGIHIHLGGIVEEAVEQHGRIVGHLDRLAHVALQVLLLVHDLHGAPAQHVAGAHHQGIADLAGVADRLFGRARGAVGRLLEAQVVEHLLEAFPVLGAVDHVRAGADDGHAVGFQVARQLERRLAAELHDDSVRTLHFHDLQHVFQGERLKVQAVGGVVVGGYRLRVAVDHDGLVAVLAQGEGGVDAAVVEFDALADTVGPAAQHHDLLALTGIGLALFLVGGIHVGGGGGELGSAGIHPLEHGAHVERMPVHAHRGLRRPEQLGQAPVGEALALERAHGLGVQILQGAAGKSALLAHDVLDLGQEPGIDAGVLVHLFQAHALAQGLGHVPQAAGTGVGQLGLDGVPVRLDLVEAV